MQPMDHPHDRVREAVLRLQEIVARDLGAAMSQAALSQAETALREILDEAPGRIGEKSFESREVTILFADLRGFTAVAAAHPAGLVLELLNRYFVKMSEIIFRHEGTIDKFLGDSIMVLFGAPTSGHEDVRRALACAVDMQNAMGEVNAVHAERGLPEFYIGIGINTGEVMAGMLGSELYSEYTVIGDHVNLASRIEAFSLRGQVLISESTFEHCRGYVETSGPMEVHVKGKKSPVMLREVLAIPSLGRTVPRQEVRRSRRVVVSLPSAYQLIENDIVMPQAFPATVLDISYHGVLAELGRALPDHAELRLDLDLSLIGYRANDVYARVLRTTKEANRLVSNLEFTSVSVESDRNIRTFVQLLIQGSDSR